MKYKVSGKTYEGERKKIAKAHKKAFSKAEKDVYGGSKPAASAAVASGSVYASHIKKGKKIMAAAAGLSGAAGSGAAKSQKTFMKKYASNFEKYFKG